MPPEDVDDLDPDILVQITLLGQDVLVLRPPKISKEGHRPHPLRGSCRPGTRTVPSSGGLPWTDTFSDLFMVEKSFFNNVTDGFEFHYKCADLNLKCKKIGNRVGESAHL